MSAPRCRLVAALLALVLLACAGCGKAAGAEAPATPSPAATQTPAPTPAPTPSPSPTPEPTPTPTPTPAPLSARSFRNIAYDSLSGAQVLDLYLPEEGDGPFPLLIYVHGGGWVEGWRTERSFGAFRSLTKHGYAVATVDYRLAAEAPQPAAVIDVKTAVRWLRANAWDYALDPERFALAGISAGAHLALTAALTDGAEGMEDPERPFAGQSAAVRAVVAWYGWLDLPALKDYAVDWGRNTQYASYIRWALGLYMGDGTVYDSYEEDLRRAGPVGWVSPDMPAVLLQHGTGDVTSPVEQSERFYALAAAAAGDGRIELDVFPGWAHADKRFEKAENMERVRAFLDTWLAP